MIDKFNFQLVQNSLLLFTDWIENVKIRNEKLNRRLACLMIKKIFL